MEHFLFVAYLILFAWFTTRTRFFLNAGLTRPQLVILFLLKVMMGIFYGWMGIYYANMAQMSDTWAHFHNSLAEYHLLGEDPAEYFTNIFHNPYQSNGVHSFLGSSDSYWNDLKGNAFAKLLSVFDIFSLGSYYVNVIFYSYLTLFGPVAFYRVMKDVYPAQKTAILIGTFLIPSFLYWSSGIHKEGLLAMSIFMIIYRVYFALKNRRWRMADFALIALHLLIILTFRNFIIAVLVPAILVWVITSYRPRHRALIYLGAYALFVALFFLMRYVDPRLDLPQAIVNKQQAFINIPGRTSIHVEPIAPTFSSFAAHITQAFSMAILRPYPSDVNHILTLAAAIEIIGMLLLMALLILFPAKKIRLSPFSLFIIFLTFSLILSIGFTVNNLGAIARYRSIVFPLFIVPVLAHINWIRISFLLGYNIKK